MGKPPGCDKNGLKKGPWTAEEDQKLIDYIQKHGHGRWRTLPKNAGLKRCGKSCRLRWTNYLRPDIKRGKFSIEEDEVIIQLHSVLGNKLRWTNYLRPDIKRGKFSIEEDEVKVIIQLHSVLGNKWSAIAARLPGRTDNEIKNYWNTHIKKKLLRMGIDPVTHAPRLDLLELSSFLSSSLYNSSLNPAGFVGSMFNPSFLSLATAFLSSNQTKNLEINNLAGDIQQIQNPYEPYQGNQVPVITQVSQADLNQFSANPGLPNLWQIDNNVSDSKGFLPTTMQNINGYNHGFYLGDQNLQQVCTFSEKIPNLVPFGSLLSTPSSSSTPLNNGSSTEDIERDSYCSSNMLIFDVPKGLNVNGCM
ncbi:hypothetical protein GOBAR_DD34423 [Gossypium barbadense]|nr:hypothetical protein GOBAR_DD34423 [Gossypium barbadense]